MTRGLFRWCGAKRHLVDHVVPLVRDHLSSTGGHLISLFAGSLAIERVIGGGRGGCTLAADASPELLNLYACLQDKPAAVHGALVSLDAEMERTPEAYRELGRRPHQPGLWGAARFLWLSAMAFNGVWRVNSDGQMNTGVDRARLAKPAVDVLPPLDAFESFAGQIHGVRFVFGWEKALAGAEPFDLLLVDPPYGEFDDYTADGFDARDHRLLARALHEAVAGRGCALIAFNAPGARSLYEWARCEEFTRSGCVSSKATKRDPVAEIVITAGLRGPA